MKLYAIRPILVGSAVVPENGEFEPVSDQHGKELIEAGYASKDAPSPDKPAKAAKPTPKKAAGK